MSRAAVLRPFFAAALGVALAVGGLAPAQAATGGPPAPGWHWVDSEEAGGPTTTPIDLSLTGDRLPGRGDEVRTDVTAPFDVQLDDVTSTAIRVHSNGWLSVGDADNAATLRLMTADMTVGNLFTQVVGEPGSRQLILQMQPLTQYGNARVQAVVTVTLFEGVPGALVTYRDVGPDGRGAATTIGLTDGLDNGPSTSSVSYDGPVTEGLALWWTNSSETAPPASEIPSTDTFGYHAVSGQPTGYADLADTGHLVVRGDSVSRTLALPFPMTVYGTEYDTLVVDTDTGFRFGSGQPPNASSDLPDPGYPDSGLLFGADLVTTISTQVRGTAPNRQYVVQWTGNRYGWNGLDGRVDIEMVLFENGQDIGVRYLDVPGGDVPAGGRPVLSHDGKTRLRLADPAADGDSLLFSLAADRTQAIVGAPESGTNTDGFGYRALRSGEAGGPTYDWVDATGGDPHLAGADEGVTTVETPFPISLYGREGSTVLLSANGYAYLGSTDKGYALALPDAGKDLLLQPYAADLVVDDGVFTQTLGTAPHRRFVVSWRAHIYATNVPVHHQLVFREDSSDVLVQYQNVDQAAALRPSLAGINRDEHDRLVWSSSGQDIADGTAVLLTLDRLMGIDPPARVRTDGRPVSLSNRVVNVSESTTSAVRQQLAIDGAGLDPATLHLEQQGEDGWAELPLTLEGGRLVATVAATDGSTFGPGVDLSTPLRLSADPGTALGTVHVTSTLQSLTGGTPSGALARASSDLELVAEAPDAPSAVAATDGDGAAHVTWTPESNGGSALTGYTVTASPGDHTVTVGPDATSADLTGLTNGTAYTVAVTATNAIGSSPAGTTTATPYGVPGKPGTPSATAGNGSATVSWEPASPNGRPVTSYTVTASPGDAFTVVDGSTTSTVVSGLTNGTAYSFTVRATNLAGAGAASDASSAITPLGVPGRPTGLTVTAGSKQLTASWTAPVDDGGTAITGYVVRVEQTGSSDPATVYEVTDTTKTITGLQNAHAYEVTVTARNVVGESLASDPASASPTLPAVTGLVASGTLTAAGQRAVTGGWSLPADATGAVACVVAGTSPAPADCSGVTVDSSLPQTVVPGATNQPVTLTVFPTDADGRGQGASVTLTPTALAATPANAKIVAGQSATLTANLTGGPAGTRTATLWSKVGAGVWKKVASVDSAGTFTAPPQSPTALTSYQWRFAGAPGILGAVSKVTKVSVEPTIQTFLAPDTIKVGKSSTVWGTLNPSLAKLKVTLQLKVGKRWVDQGTAVVKRQLMPDKTKVVGYRFTVTGTKKGPLTYRVVSPKTAANLAATGPSVVLTVG